MGHSAKFRAYTIFCCTLPMIIHFAHMQVGKKVIVYSDNIIGAVTVHVKFLLLHYFRKCNILWMSTVT